jgi:hypothetical protein
MIDINERVECPNCMAMLDVDVDSTEIKDHCITCRTCGLEILVTSEVTIEMNVQLKHPQQKFSREVLVKKIGVLNGTLRYHEKSMKDGTASEKVRKTWRSTIAQLEEYSTELNKLEAIINA